MRAFISKIETNVYILTMIFVTLIVCRAIFCTILPRRILFHNFDTCRIQMESNSFLYTSKHQGNVKIS